MMSLFSIVVLVLAIHGMVVRVEGNSGGTTTAVAAETISANSLLGRKLMLLAEKVEDGTDARALAENNNNDYSFLNDYSIKFQGCHHVQQWNENNDEESDVKIMTKRLVRFRLCLSDMCLTDKSVGCTSKFGDYIVDMDTFLEAYWQALEEDTDEVCGDALTDCTATCGGSEDSSNSDSSSSCMESCFASYNLQECYNYYNNDNNNNQNDFDVKDYAGCQEFNLPARRHRQLEEVEEEVQYYIGAFCADQGGEIHLGLFTDDTCTTFASNGYYLFESAMGFSMPYSESSLITNRCLNCIDSNNGGSKEVCSATYQMAGKCETRMSIDYPNESSCNYIEGIRIIREDGVIRTSATKKSKAAAVAIGLFTTLSVLLAAYVFYLRTKLSRAQINLAASAEPLT